MILSWIICVTKESHLSSFDLSFLVFKMRGMKQMFSKVPSSFEKLVPFKLFVLKYFQGKFSRVKFSPFSDSGKEPLVMLMEAQIRDWVHLVYDPYGLYPFPWQGKGDGGNRRVVRILDILGWRYSTQLSCFNYIDIINHLLIKTKLFFTLLGKGKG